jgi:HK97 family phage major capsid protein/HK97 family phage prohead protease
MAKKKKIKTGVLYRSFELYRENIITENRSIDLSFSSEAPVERYFGYEILDHSPGSVRLDRMRNGGPLLVDHDRTDLAGVIEDISIGSDRKGRAVARFGKSARAEEIYNDVLDGIRSNVSVGYRIHKMILEKEEDDVGTYRATEWEPVEISLVSIPADTTVGVGRGEGTEYEINVVSTIKEEQRMEKCTKCGADLVNGKCAACETRIAAESARSDAEKTERTRVSEIMAIGQKHGLMDLALEYVRDGKPLDAFRSAVIDKISNAHTFTISGGDNLAAQSPYRSFGEQLIDIMAVDRPNGALARERLMHVQRAISGMSTSVPSDGGYLIQSQFTTALLDKPEEVSQVWARCQRFPIGAGFDSLEAPFIDETSRATGSRWGGVQVYREGESLYPSGKKPKIGQYEIRLYDIKGICYATNRLLQNAVTLEAWIYKAFRSEMFFKLDDEVIRGTGAGQCTGITVGPSTVSVDGETGQLADTICTENILNMYNALFASSRGTAVWLYQQDLEPQLETLSYAIGTGGVLMPLFVPAGVGNNMTPVAKLKGLPAFPIEQASAKGDAGDIILADLANGYITIDQGGIDAQSSIHVKFLEDETAFRFTYRANGAPRLRSTVAAYKGSTYRSHLVMLAAR